MSGPLRDPTGTLDGVTWTERVDLSIDGGMVVPPVAHSNPITPPSYYAGPLPYYGDFQLSAAPGQNMQLVIEFDKPIKQIRTTAQFVGASALAMYAVVQESDFSGGGLVFTSPKFVTWDLSTSGTRTLTYEPGFRFVVLRTLVISSQNNSLTFGPTFRNTFFFENITAPESFEPFEPDLHVPRGVGRTISLHWPAAAFGAGDPISGGMRVRQDWTANVGTSATMLSGILGAGTGPDGSVYYRNKYALRMAAAAGSLGRVFSPQGGTSRNTQIYIATQQPNRALIGKLDEIAWWELHMTMAFEQPSGVIGGDVGMVIGQGLNIRIRDSVAKQAGFSFGLRDIDTLGLSIRKVTGAALTYDKTYVPGNQLPAGFDLEDWHDYKLRLNSADFGLDAALQVLVDDQVIDTIAFPGIAPDPSDGSTIGYYWAWSNQNRDSGVTSRLYLAHEGLALIASSTETGLA
ncbi:MAG TPA: hypothetical protein VL333_13250 [Candidatus Saccharimonadales bacterium]|jgi:hypothetical protein|nr:hypothetical protein [Candidatus Saccharimonadales bacterium]